MAGRKLFTCLDSSPNYLPPSILLQDHTSHQHSARPSTLCSAWAAGQITSSGQHVQLCIQQMGQSLASGCIRQLLTVRCMAPALLRTVLQRV